MSLNDVSLALVEGPDDVRAFRAWAEESREVLAFDTETSGLDWWRHRVRLVQFGDERTGWAMDFERFRELAAWALRRHRGTFVAHNAAFDERMLTESGIQVPRDRIADTSLMAHVLDNQRLRGLKPLARMLIDRRATSGQEALDTGMKENKWTWDTVPVNFAPYWAYGALDPVLAARLYAKFMPLLRRDSSLMKIYELERRVMWILSDMARRGLPLDLEYTAWLQGDLTRREEEALRQISDGWPTLRKRDGAVVLSPDRLSAIFLADGCTLNEKTPTGKWKVDKELLANIAEGGHPLASLVQTAKQMRKWRVAYVDAILEGSHNGRMHPSVNQLGARTGRMSVSRPALQQLPSSGALIRDTVLAGRGKGLISVDYDQIELRVLAHVAQEQSMIRAIETGEDMHMSNARMLYGPSAGKGERKMAKGGAFAKVYGAGPRKLAAQQGIPLAQAKKFMKDFDHTFTGVAGAAQAIQRAIKSRELDEGRGYIRTRFGRRLYVEEEKEYKGLNYYCQGTAADILKMGLVRLEDAGLAQYALLPVHDEVIFEVPEADAPDVLAAAAHALTDSENFRVPISASGDVYRRWGDGYTRDAEIEEMLNGQDAVLSS